VDVSVQRLAPIAGEMRRLMDDPGYIDGVLIEGADRARVIARETMDAVKDIVGFVRPR
jgi:tryptophanyl-tRNA synthetase